MSRPPGKYEDDVACRLCGKAFLAISWAHLKYRHHLAGETAVSDYKARFGVSRVRCAASERKRQRSYGAYLDSIGRRWSKVLVIESIQRRIAAGQPLNQAEVIRDGGGSLVSAASRHFGDWGRALRSAGADPWNAAKQHHWPKDRLIQELRSFAVNGTFIRKKSPKRANTLYAAARGVFGSWQNAMREARLRSQLPPRVSWTREEVLRRIRSRARDGLPLSSNAVAKSDHALHHAARRIMGKPWNLIAAELGHRVKISWTKPLLCRELRLWVKTGRISLPGISYSALYQAACEHYGSWWRAHSAAGIRPRRPPLTRWSKDEVLRRIRRRHRKRLSLSWRAVWGSERDLYKNTKRFLGKSWLRAIRDLGYDGRSSRIFWTKDLVLAEVRGLHEKGRLSPGVTKKKLGLAAWRLFGSYSRAKTLALRLMR